MRTALSWPGPLVLVLSLACIRVVPAFAQGDAAAGRLIFSQKCASCHTITADSVPTPNGPSLVGVVGRRAGVAPGWVYSPALRASGNEFHPRGRAYLFWSGENLDKFLTEPKTFVPGSRMDLKMPDPTERANVIAYMRSVLPPPGMLPVDKHPN